MCVCYIYQIINGHKLIAYSNHANKSAFQTKELTRLRIAPFSLVKPKLKALTSV